MRGISARIRPVRSKHRTKHLKRVSLALLLSAAFLAAGCKQSQREDSAPSLTTSPMPSLNRHIYSQTADPKADIAAAITQAGKENKRIILVFGGDWCADCQVLDIYLRENPNLQLLAQNFILVHVDIGQMDHNVDIASKYKVPIQLGVPALAVLDSSGNLLFSQQNKEFENMRNMNVASVTEFLNRWKS
jgi:thiol:disulfide interchange protein